MDKERLLALQKARHNLTGGNRAATTVWRAIKRGKLAKLDGSIPCKDCGAKATHYDHRDYNKPLEVEPVCASCNQKRGPADVFKRPPTPEYITEYSRRGAFESHKRYLQSLKKRA